MKLLLQAEHPDPFHLLGPHPAEAAGRPCLVIQAFQPHARELSVVVAGRAPEPAARLHPDGFFRGLIPAPPDASPTSYRLRIIESNGATREIFDPYAFPPLLSAFDLHLIGEGTHYQNYEKLGAHLGEVAGARGVHFAVWAPNALRVSVVGDFNGWDGRLHPMRNCGASGVWELFIAELEAGLIYKFEIRSRFGSLPFLKADPYAFYAEVRPKSGSVVAEIGGYRWGDAAWMEERAKRDWLSAPIAAYEVHLGSWRRLQQERSRPDQIHRDGTIGAPDRFGSSRPDQIHRDGPDRHSFGGWLSYRELAGQLVPYVKRMGFTHVELLPIMEHPLDASWGYQTLGYFAPTSRFGPPNELMGLIDSFHQAGIGVLLDWTPAHFPRDGHGLGMFDGTHLYEHADPRQGAHPDWGTFVFNYSRNEVQNFLLSNALFWLDKYHIDGLRVDAVASMLYLDYSRKAGEWIPNEYGGRENLAAIALLKRMNELVHGKFPGVLTIAEESTAWPMVSQPSYLGGLGFSLKWNMGWMNDTLRYMSLDPIYRKYQHNELTFSMLYAFTENFVLPLSHDEVTQGKGSLLGKMAGDDWQKFANLRLLFGYFYCHPGKKLLFMGGELAQRNEWWHEASLDWELAEHEAHHGIQRLVADLNRLHVSEPALHEVDFDCAGFEWIDCHDADASVLSFIRRARAREDFIVVALNFTPVVRENYRVGVPAKGFYREILNTDSAMYGGSNAGNAGGAEAEAIAWNGRPYSLKLRLPPLAAVIFKPGRGRN